MFLRIDTQHQKKLVGRKLRMSLIDNRTFELWSSFMPHRNKIPGITGSDLYSVQVYDSVLNLQPFNPAEEFDKWAAAEVNSVQYIPDGMETLVIPAGLYAVFLHKGTADKAPQTFRYIFSEWLPSSGYILDARPHFEILGEKYKNNHPDSEEGVWIPIRPA